jgi:hypothetical protein
MYADDVTWGLNRTRGDYELFFYNLNSGSNRMVAVEMAPMALHSLCSRIMATIDHDFPPRTYPGIERNTGEQAADSSTMGADSTNTPKE